MTATTTSPAGGGSAERPVQPLAAELVSLTIDGVEVAVPKGTLVIRAAELVGIEVPRFCDHPLLDPVGACRQCLVDIEGQRKPLTSCTTTVADGMVVRTQLTSAAAEKAQRGILELLLINHPLDCPVCDKGGECPLQNQAMGNGQSESRFHDVKRTFPKPIPISAQVLLDRERCVLCARCTRFSEQIAGDPFIEMLERGALQQVGIYADAPFESYFSGNTVQICPVGALTGRSYRFRARPFDLVSSPSVCEHCAAGCALRTDHRRGKVTRRLAGEDPQVNEEWSCDKGRWAFAYATGPDRLTTPLVRRASGTLEPTSWPEALEAAAAGLRAARTGGGVGVLAGGRVTLEDAYAYAKFARVVLDTNDVDFRARPHSAEEADFLAAAVAGTGVGVTYQQLERAPVVVLAGLEAEEECPILFLRLRKAVRRHGLAVHALAPFPTPGLTKLAGQLLQTPPGAEAATLTALAGAPSTGAAAETAHALRTPGAVLLVGERLAETPGALTAAVRLASATGAQLAWVPRRAGERGAIEAGVLPGLLPGGRPVADEAARAELDDLWAVQLPAKTGRSTDEILAAATSGGLAGLVIGGVDLDDLADPATARNALAKAAFVVSLDLRTSSVSEYADVVLPVAAVVEKSGTFLDWEGRERPFPKTLVRDDALSDHKVLDMLAAELDVALGTGTAQAVRAELGRLGSYAGPRSAAPTVPVAPSPTPGGGEAVLATWHQLLDAGTLQEGEEPLAGTARKARVGLSPATAAAIGAGAGDEVVVASSRGSITLPLALMAMPDGVVWLPTNARGSAVRRDLAAGSGSIVRIAKGGGAR